MCCKVARHLADSVPQRTQALIVKIESDIFWGSEELLRRSASTLKGSCKTFSEAVGLLGSSFYFHCISS